MRKNILKNYIDKQSWGSSGGGMLGGISSATTRNISR